MTEKQRQERVAQAAEAVPGLYRYARSKLARSEDAEDLMQDVLLQTLTRLNTLEAVDNLADWMFTVLKNRIIDTYRRFRRPTMSLDEVSQTGTRLSDVIASEIIDPLEGLARDAVLDAVTDAIDALPPDQQFVFVEQIIEGRSFRELAEETGVSINTLIARKQAAVRVLRKRLKKVRNLLTE